MKDEIQYVGIYKIYKDLGLGHWIIKYWEVNNTSLKGIKCTYFDELNTVRFGIGTFGIGIMEWHTHRL